MDETKSIDLEAYTTDLEHLYSCILTDNTIIDSMRFRPEMSLRSIGRIVLETMQEQYRAGVKIDLLTINDALISKGPEHDAARSWATQKLHAWSSANWEFYEKRIIDMWIKSKILQLSRLLESEATSQSTTGDDLIAMLEETQTQLATLEAQDSILDAAQMMQPVIDIIEDRYKLHGKLPGIPTGFETLDKKTLGFQEGILWVIGARPSQGKSALAKQMALHTAMVENVKTGVITIESSSSEFGMRSLAQIGNIDASVLARGVFTKQDFADIKFAKDRIAAMGKTFIIFDKARMTISEVWSMCRRMVIKFGVKIIFIDYLQRIRVPKQKTKFEEVALATTELKEIARSLNITVVALAQLRREADDKKPGLGDFQYTSQIEQDADVALMIWHEETFEKVKDPKTGNEYKNPIKRSWIIAEKVRDGQTGDIQVEFKREVMRFGEIEQRAER